MSTILDHNPYFNYAKYLGKKNIKDIKPLIKNMAEIPKEFDG